MDERETMEHTGGPVTRSRITRDLRALGVADGDVVMFHTRLSAVGWVPGGPQTVIAALLDAVGPAGTLLTYCGWNDAPPYAWTTWPAAWQTAIRAEHPPFDPALSPSDHAVGRLPEALRHWPGARRSRHPDVSFAAVGALAHELIAAHPWDDPHGPGTPLARLVDHGGKVLLLGAPLDTMTLLHHAEALAQAPGKRFVAYEQPIAVDGERAWRTFRDIDSEEGAFDYTPVVPEDEEPFEVIAQAALDAGVGRAGTVGAAASHLFPARDVVRFAVDWIERELG